MSEKQLNYGISELDNNIILKEKISSAEKESQKISAKLDNLNGKVNLKLQHKLAILNLGISETKINEGLKSLIKTGERKIVNLEITYNKEKNEYRIISGNYIVDIPLSISGLNKYLKILEKLLIEKDKLKMSGNENTRTIYSYDWGLIENKIKILHKEVQELYEIDNNETFRKDGKNFELNNNYVERLFVFAKNIRGEKIGENDIKGICKGFVDQNCIDNLGVSKNIKNPINSNKK